MLKTEAQICNRLTSAVSIGTGIDTCTPSYNPVTVHFTEYYNFNNRLSLGIGTGVSIYEKTIVPLFADIHYNITKPKKIMPYLSCSIGYGFTQSKHANGGMYFNPSFGLQYPLHKHCKIFVAVGYETQKLERLKKYEDQYFEMEFNEHLQHNSISAKLGITF